MPEIRAFISQQDITRFEIIMQYTDGMNGSHSTSDI